MKNLKPQKLKHFQINRNLFSSVTAVFVVPLYFLAICAESYANDLRNTAAAVDTPSTAKRGNGVIFLDGTTQKDADRSVRLWNSPKRKLEVSPRKTARFSIVTRFTTAETRLANTHFGTRSENRKFTYTYPCSIQGSSVIGWEKGMQSNCAAIAIKLEATLKANKELSKNLLKAETAKNYDKNFQYCSAVAESGSGWGAVVTQTKWDFLSPNDPCNEAIRRCEESLTLDKSPCIVVNFGEKDIEELDEEFTAVLKCSIEDIDIHREQKIPAELDRWLLQQRDTLKSSSCMLQVLNSDELLVFPTTSDPTLVATGEDIKPFNEPVIVALAGRVKIVSPDPVREPSEIGAGNACYPYGISTGDSSSILSNTPSQSPIASPLPSNQTPVFARQQQQQQQQQQQAPFPVVNPTCQSIDQLIPGVREVVARDNAVIKDFFLIAPADAPEAEGWSSVFAESIESYKEPVLREFGTYDGEAIEGFASLLP